jgi:hypothetical protein
MTCTPERRRWDAQAMWLARYGSAAVFSAWTAAAHAHGGEAIVLMLGLVVAGLLFPMVIFLFSWRGTLGQKLILSGVYVASIAGSVFLVSAVVPMRHTLIFLVLLMGIPFCVWADLVLRWRNSPQQGPRIVLLAVAAAGAITWLGSEYRPPGALGSLLDSLQPLVFVPYVVGGVFGHTPNSPFDAPVFVALIVEFALLFWLVLRVWRRIRSPAAGRATTATTTTTS